jgi:hypothetical protein
MEKIKMKVTKLFIILLQIELFKLELKQEVGRMYPIHDAEDFNMKYKKLLEQKIKELKETN